MTRQVAPGPASAVAGPGPVPDAPYKGLQPYAEEDAAIFFGRESERRVLIANLLATRLTLLYGESGVGKSSLLRAGVVSHLREQERLGARPRSAARLRIVFFNEWSGDPVARLVARIEEECHCAGDQPGGTGLAGGGLDRPAALADTLEAWTAERNVQVLLILDQFEEYFLYHRDEDDEAGFAAQLSRAVNHRGIPVSFLVAIREDALAKLDRFKGRIPGLFENYLRVRHLRAGQAARAVTGPLERLSRLTPEAEPFGVDPELVAEVLDQVQVGKVVLSVAGRGTVAGTAGRDEADPPIETPYLQMVLSRLWSEERRLGSRRLRLETLRRLGGARQIVRTHLDEAMAALAPDEQAAAAGVFHYLVTPSGSKISHTLADLADYAGLDQARVRAVLAKLSAADVRIVRAVAAPADEDGEPRFEIFHDVLAPAVLDWRARWQVERRGAEEREAGRRLLEERARRWRRRRIVGGVLVAVLAVALLGLAVQSERDERTAVRQEAAAREVAGQATRRPGVVVAGLHGAGGRDLRQGHRRDRGAGPAAVAGAGAGGLHRLARRDRAGRRRDPPRLVAPAGAAGRCRPGGDGPQPVRQLAQAVRVGVAGPGRRRARGRRAPAAAGRADRPGLPAGGPAERLPRLRGRAAAVALTRPGLRTRDGTAGGGRAATGARRHDAGRW